jgi:hypothetical protein
LRHRDDVHNRANRSICLSEALQLHKTLVALDSSLSQEFPTPGPDGFSLEASTLCCSARLILYNLYGCNEPDDIHSDQVRQAEETEMQQVAIQGIKNVIFVRMPCISNVIAMSTDLLSPLTCYSFYHTASEYAWFVRENPAIETANLLKTFIEFLRTMAKRWKIAGMVISNFLVR